MFLPVSHVGGKMHRVVDIDILICLTLQACFAPGLEFKRRSIDMSGMSNHEM